MNKRPAITLIVGSFFLLLLFSVLVIAADPEGPTQLAIDDNETKTASAKYNLTIAGGRIATLNVNSTKQNLRWKAFVGQLSSSLVLVDSTSSKIFDWAQTTIASKIMATRNSSTISWSQIKCANTTIMEEENDLMSHTQTYDNITKTFNDTTHSEFTVGSVSFVQDSCPTLNTYVNNATQDTTFQEMVLFDGVSDENPGNLVYLARLEQNSNGFDSNAYDFQMLVPEIGTVGNTVQTPYYLYVEVD